VFCFANKKMMFSTLLTRSSKMYIYKILIRPGTYGCETWVLKDIHEQQLKSVLKEK
jgi:hypothetical protein